MSLTFHLNTAANGEFFFNLKEGDTILLKSETYKQKASCKNGIASVKKHSQHDKYYARAMNKNGKPYFNLKSSNGQIVGTSAFFKDEEECNATIKTLIKSTAKAKLIEG